ncbi:hypothetical protein M569_13681, partial [Genlisea aurea]
FQAQVVNYSLQIGREFVTYQVQEGKHVEFRCKRRHEQGCQWRIRCAYFRKYALWKITEIEEPHSCERHG